MIIDSTQKDILLKLSPAETSVIQTALNWLQSLYSKPPIQRLSKMEYKGVQEDQELLTEYLISERNYRKSLCGLLEKLFIPNKTIQISKESADTLVKCLNEFRIQYALEQEISEEEMQQPEKSPNGYKIIMIHYLGAFCAELLERL